MPDAAPLYGYGGLQLAPRGDDRPRFTLARSPVPQWVSAERVVQLHRSGLGVTRPKTWGFGVDNHVDKQKDMP
jgi:hypothetical protein